MSDYKVLYRKWRPRILGDVVGQPQVTRTLLNELKTGRVAHAFLFTGSRGTGKTSCAKILAKAVNCLSPVDGEPCNNCEICRGIDDESVLDVVEMDAASNNGIDNIRDLRSELNYTPSKAKYRVFIIDEVHMLSVSAFNALLKTLEEPPAHAIFILATTDVHKLPATILSRCQRFDFHRISPEEICSRLKYIAEQENGSLTDDAAMLIARLSDGGMRDALSTLDQCMGVSPDVTENIVEETAGLSGREFLYSIVDAVRESNMAAVLEKIDELYRNSKDIVRLTNELISHFRMIMIMKNVKNPHELLAVSSGEYQRLTEQSAGMKLDFVLHAINALSQSLDRMSHGADRRTELEMCILRLCKPELDSSNDALLRRISALEDKVSNIGETGIQTDLSILRKQMKEKAPVSAGEYESVSCEDAEPIEQWREIIEALERVSKPLYSALRDSNGYIKGNMVFVETSLTGTEILRTQSFRGYLRDAVKNKLGIECRLGPYKSKKKDSKQTTALDEFEKRAAEAGIVIETTED